MAYPTCSLVLVALVTLALVAVDAQKEARFKTCKRKQPLPQLNECVKDAIQQVLPSLAKGMPEYSINPIDPLRVIKLEVPKGKGAVSVDLTFKNLDIIGLKNLKISSAEMNVEKMLLRAKAYVDGTVTLLGDYEVNGKVLVLPIQGKGRCNITIVNPKLDIQELQAKPVMKKGKQYATVTSFKIKVIDAEKAFFNLENLFNGNKQLGDNMNTVLNDNWKEIYEEMVGPVATTVSVAIRNVVEYLVSKVPYEKIFPL